MGYKFIGNAAGDGAGISVASAGDVDGDNTNDLLIGAFDSLGSLSAFGQVYLIDEDQLAAADAADGIADGTIDLGNIAGLPGSYTFVGEETGDAAGFRVSSAGDVDGDGKDDLLISAPFHSGTGSEAGAAYLINANDLAAADLADGTADGAIELANIAAQTSSFKFIGADLDTAGFGLSTVFDIDMDGRDEFAIGAPAASDFGSDGGAVYVIDGLDLVAADAADGTSDGVVDLAFVAAQTNSFRIYSSVDNLAIGTSVARLGDVSGDSRAEFMLWAAADDLVVNPFSMMVNSGDLAAADALDGNTDGNVDLADLIAPGGSYLIEGEAGDSNFTAVAFPGGDYTGDGVPDLLVTAPLFPAGTGDNGALYLLDGTQLAAADGADGTTDGVIALPAFQAQTNSWRFVGATDNDESGVSASLAGDTDNDGQNDLLIGNNGFQGVGDPIPTVAAYLINADAFAAADAVDGTVDHSVNLSNAWGLTGSYRFVDTALNPKDTVEVEFVGDIDGDLKDDFMIGLDAASGGKGEVYLVLSGQLAAYDAADGTVDGDIQLSNIDCFARGTLIATPQGETPVEDLRIGDAVMTADGSAVPVRWIGRQTVSRRFGGPRAQMVRIAAGALGNHSDLFVTGDHGMVLEGLVVNASALVNGATIDWVPLAETPERFTVYHVETERHDVILANGAPTETFIDYAGRQRFDNHAEHVALYGEDRTIAENPLPRVSAARHLPPAIRTRLNAQALRRAG